jgi:hypothetical protein
MSAVDLLNIEEGPTGMRRVLSCGLLSPFYLLGLDADASRMTDF